MQKFQEAAKRVCWSTVFVIYHEDDMCFVILYRTTWLAVETKMLIVVMREQQHICAKTHLIRARPHLILNNNAVLWQHLHTIQLWTLAAFCEGKSWTVTSWLFKFYDIFSSVLCEGFVRKDLCCNKHSCWIISPKPCCTSYI